AAARRPGAPRPAAARRGAGTARPRARADVPEPRPPVRHRAPQEARVAGEHAAEFLIEACVGYNPLRWPPLPVNVRLTYISSARLLKAGCRGVQLRFEQSIRTACHRTR